MSSLMSIREQREKEAERKQELWKDLVDHVGRGEKAVEILSSIHIAGISGGLEQHPRKSRVFVEMSVDLWQKIEQFFYCD